MAVKSRARRILEAHGPATPVRRPSRLNEDGTPAADGDTAGATGTGTPPGTAQASVASGAQGATPDDNQPHSPEMEGFMKENASQPDGMAGVMDATSAMMDSYMNEDDTSTFTPSDDEERGMVTEAKGKMMESARMMREIMQRKGVHT